MGAFRAARTRAEINNRLFSNCYLIQRIIEKEKIYKNNFFYVGDKLNDYDASKNVGCSFIPISDDDEFKKLNIKVFNNLYDLINIFKTKI